MMNRKQQWVLSLIIFYHQIILSFSSFVVVPKGAGDVVTSGPATMTTMRRKRIFKLLTLKNDNSMSKTTTRSSRFSSLFSFRNKSSSSSSSSTTKRFVSAISSETRTVADTINQQRKGKKKDNNVSKEENEEDKQNNLKWWEYPICIQPSASDKKKGVIVAVMDDDENEHDQKNYDYDNDDKKKNDQKYVSGINKSYFIYNPQGIKENTPSSTATSITTSSSFDDLCSHYLCPPIWKVDNDNNKNKNENIDNDLDVTIHWSFPIIDIEDDSKKYVDDEIAFHAQLAAKEMVQQCIEYNNDKNNNQQGQRQRQENRNNVNESKINFHTGSMATDTSFCNQLEDILLDSFQEFGKFCYEHSKQQRNRNNNDNDNNDIDITSSSSSCECCDDHNHNDNTKEEKNNNNKNTMLTFKARLVASRGQKGTVCPQWHVDYVPVRWIQSLVGPGCEMVVVDTTKNGHDNDNNIHNNVINWNYMNGGSLQRVRDAITKNNNNNINWSPNSIKYMNDHGISNDEDDVDDDVNDTFFSSSVHDRNNILVDINSATIYQGKPYEGIVIVGERWDEFLFNSPYYSHHSDSSSNENSNSNNVLVLPVVHKSPSNLSSYQPRVRLTQDITVLDE